MAKHKPPRYTLAPELPEEPELRQRFAQIVAVLAQTQTVSGAARTLDLSRNHFQTILHRVISAMIEELTPKPAGRPAKPARGGGARGGECETAGGERGAENQDGGGREDADGGGLDRFWKDARQSQPRSRGKKTKTEDPEPAAIRTQAVIAMREQGASPKLCAAALGVSRSTVRRCKRASTATVKLGKPRDPEVCKQVRILVRETHGLAGARSLGRMTGLPRRICAEIKKRERRETELERKARCASVTVTRPGIIRGFDAMHARCTDRAAYILVAADAAIPYRTSLTLVDTYDAQSVIAALAQDFETHGPPLVLRLDRIACQRTAEVLELLRLFEVLPLHGPPRHPLFYGQLERQNREHRAWERALGPVTRNELAASLPSMRMALNAQWARPTLDWCTAETAWERRKPTVVDRRELRTHVERRTSGLCTAGVEPLRAQRLAIEALTERGLLTINQGGWC